MRIKELTCLIEKTTPISVIRANRQEYSGSAENYDGCDYEIKKIIPVQYMADAYMMLIQRIAIIAK